MARRQVSIFINGKEVANQIKSITAEKRKIVRELNRMTVGSTEYNNKVKELNKVNGVLEKHRNKVRGMGGIWKKMKGAVGKFAIAAAAAFVAKELIAYGAKLGELALNMELLDKKARIVFGDALPLVNKAAQENANAMGLTVSQYTDAAAAIGDLLVPMGFQREEAAAISSQMVNLSGALSQWTGGQLEAKEVSEILGKAMLGEREQLKQLGIQLNEADVKSRLASKGLENLTGASLQQAKAAATLELITERSIDAQTSFGSNSDTLASKKAALSAKITQVSENLAKTLLPVFKRLIDIALQVADAVVWASESFGDLVGSSEESASKLEENATSANTYTDAIDEAGNSTDKLKEAEERLAKSEALEVAKEKAKKLAEERAKEAKEAAEDLVKREQTVQDAITKLQEESNLKRLSEADRQLAELSERYDKQIQIAREAEAKGSEEAIEQIRVLERLKQEALSELNQQQVESDLERIAAEEELKTVAELQALRTREEAKRAAQEQIKEEVLQVVLTERELELLELENHFQAVMQLAQEHGLDTLDIEIAHRRKKSEAIKKFDQEDKAQLIKSQSEQAKILAESFKAANIIIGGAMDLLGDKAKENTVLGKALTLTQIGIDTAAAISSLTRNSEANPANAVTFGGAGIAQFAAGLVRILANIGQARKLLQKKDGGWHNVVGEDDNKTYKAKYIGYQPTGMLPNHPVVLASEAGREYFVSNSDLQNPHVIDHVRAIENIVHHRMPQYVEGGFTNDNQSDLDNRNTDSPQNDMMIEMIQILKEIRLEIRRKEFKVSDNNLVDIFDRFNSINSASGGFFR